MILKRLIKQILIEADVKNTKNISSAGIVIVKKFNNDWKVLGLLTSGKYDIPKGIKEKNETDLETAIRETYEESNLKLSDKNFKWGKKSLKVEPITIFLAEVWDNPMIIKNPKTGIYEHELAEWLSWDEMTEHVKEYLAPAILWAKKIVENNSKE